MIGDFEEITKIRELLAGQPRGMSITEISRELGMHRTTVAKYLDGLQMKGEVDMRVVSTAKMYHLQTRIPTSSIRHFSRDPFILVSHRQMIISVSEGVAELVGLKEDPAGMSIVDPRLSPLMQEDVPALIKKAIHGDRGQADLSLIRKGVAIWLKTDLLPVVFDDGRPGCAIICHDETQYHEAVLRAELCAGENEALTSDQSEFIFRSRPDGTLTFVNEAFCRRMERKRSDLIGFPYEPVISHEDQEKLSQMKNAVTKQNPVAKITFKAIQPDGMVAWEEWLYRGIFSNTSTLTGYQAVGRDVSDRRHLEDQLQTYHANFEAIIKQRTREMRAANQDLMAEIARREKLERELLIIRFVFDHASDSILLFDREGGMYRANETACTLLGYSGDEIQNITVFDVNPEITPDVWNEMWSSADTDADICRVRSVHRRRDGEIFPVEISRKFITAGPISLFCSIARKVEDSHGGNGEEKEVCGNLKSE